MCIFSDILFWNFIWHSIPAFYSGILFLSGIYSDIFSWHSIWHSFRSIWHLFWHSFWHLFWHAIWHLFWHSILAFYLASILTFYSAILSATSWKRSTRGEGKEVGKRRRKRRRRRRGVAPFFKSRDPHLAGGEHNEHTYAATLASQNEGKRYLYIYI